MNIYVYIGAGIFLAYIACVAVYFKRVVLKSRKIDCPKRMEEENE